MFDDDNDDDDDDDDDSTDDDDDDSYDDDDDDDGEVIVGYVVVVDYVVVDYDDDGLLGKGVITIVPAGDSDDAYIINYARYLCIIISYLTPLIHPSLHPHIYLIKFPL